MKIIESLEDVDSIDFIVLTGDGIWELRVLKGIQKKFQCTHTLFYPKLPLLRKTGKSVYRAIPVYISKYGVNKFLVLCDNEHHKSFDEDLKILKNLNIKILKTEELVKDRILYIFGEFASRKLEIYAIIQGFNREKDCKGLNEEISKLIYLKFNEKVEPNHGKIRDFLKKKRIDLTGLIEQTGIKYSENSLTIYKVLKTIHDREF